MEYTLNFNNREYQLPPKTIDIEEKIETIDMENGSASIRKRKKYENMFRFIKEQVGEENAKEIFETDDVTGISGIDLCSITICYLGIVNAYDAPIRNYKKSELEGEISKLNLNDIGKLADMVKTLENMDAKSANRKR